MMQRAANFRFTIDGVAYAVANVRVGAGVQPCVVSNSEGQPGNPDYPAALGYTSVIPDLAEGQMELQSASYDPDNSPFDAPLSLVQGNYYDLNGYPAGTAELEYHYGNCMLVRIEHTARIPGPSPVNLVFQTDGSFNLPGQ